MGAIKTKSKHKIIMTQKINVESSHKSDQSGKTFKKLPLEAFEGSTFSHPLLYWVQSDLNVKSYVDIFCFHSCKSAMCQHPNAAYLSQSPCCLQHRGSIIYQTKPSCLTTLICMQPAAKAKPSQDTRRLNRDQLKQIRASLSPLLRVMLLKFQRGLTLR